MDRVVLSSSERSDFNKKLQPHPQMAVQQSGRQHNPNDSVDRQLEDMNRLINQRNQNEEQVDSRVKPVQARGSHPVELSSVLNKSQSAHHHRIISASHDEIDFDVPKERSERIGAESLDSGKPKRFEAIAQKHAEKDDPFGSNPPIKIVEDFSSPHESIFKKGYGQEPSSHQPVNPRESLNSHLNSSKKPGPLEGQLPENSSMSGPARQMISNQSDDYADFHVPEEKSHPSHKFNPMHNKSVDKERLAILESEEDEQDFFQKHSAGSQKVQPPASGPMFSHGNQPDAKAQIISNPSMSEKPPIVYNTRFHTALNHNNQNDFGKFFEENTTKHKMSRIEEVPYENDDLSDKGKASHSGAIKGSRFEYDDPNIHNSGAINAGPKNIIAGADHSSQSLVSHPSRSRIDLQNPRSQQNLPFGSAEHKSGTESGRVTIPISKVKDKSVVLKFEPPQSDDVDQPFQYQPDYFQGPPKAPLNLIRSERSVHERVVSPEQEIEERRPRRIVSHLIHPVVDLAPVLERPPESQARYDPAAIEQVLQPRLREFESKYQNLESEVARLHAELAQAKKEKESLLVNKSPSVVGRAGDSGYFIGGPNSGGPSQHVENMTFQPKHQDSNSASNRINQIQLDHRMSIPARVSNVYHTDTHYNEFEEKYKKEKEEKAKLLKEIGLLRLMNEQNNTRTGVNSIKSGSSGYRTHIEREPFVSRDPDDDALSKIREYAQGKVSGSKMDMLLDSRGILNETEDTILEIIFENNLSVRDERFYLKGKLLITNKKSLPLLGFLLQMNDLSERRPAP